MRNQKEGTVTVGDLIARLRDYDENAEVRFASQPDWPMEYTIDTDATTEVEGVVYVVEGRQVGYLDEEASIALGWQDEDCPEDPYEDHPASDLHEDYPGQRFPDGSPDYSGVMRSG
jgi:hypothetical protein